jgi:hypothetical protein
VRVYLSTTMNALPGLLQDRGIVGGLGSAVTPGLREWYASGDEEELEYAALGRAARQSLMLLADEVTAPRRRVVLAADVAEEAVRPSTDGDPAAVQVQGAIPISAIRAIHVDDLATVPLVRAALIEPDDEMVQGDLEDADLLWYATQELDELLSS